MNHTDLGSFLKHRRSQVRPADVGLPAGPRRRVPGLRRDEVARLADMSVDYYTELEKGRGQTPSPQILTALGRALRLDVDGLAHLQHLAGHQAPLGADPAPMQHALVQLLERLRDTPAMIITDLHQVLVQNRLSQALIGPLPTGHGLDANFAHQWFADLAVREIFPPEDRASQSRVLAYDLRAAAARRGRDAASTELIDLLLRFPEFAALWEAHEVAVPREERKAIAHPVLGTVEVSRNSFYTADAAQRLLWMVPYDDTVTARLSTLDVREAWGDRAARAAARRSHRPGLADGQAPAGADVR
jgi:transcriptional regulator with XRE-family HTH domain